MAGSVLIGAIRATLGLNTAEFEKGADRAVAKMDAVSRAGFATGRAIRGLAGLAATTGLAIASMFTVSSIKSALEYAASLQEVATQLGVTTTELQVYRFAAGQVGITQEQLDKGLAKLTLSIGKAGAGAAQEARAFETLGIAVKDAEGNIRPTGDVLLDLADKIKAIPEPANRMAAASAVLGRKLGGTFITLLEQGSAGLKEFAKQAEAAGLVIAEGDIAKADETADKIEALTTQLKVNFSNEVAQNADAILSLANALSSLIGWLVKAGAAYVNFFQGVGRLAARGIINLKLATGQVTSQQIGDNLGFNFGQMVGQGIAAPRGAGAAGAAGGGTDLEGLFGGGGGGGRGRGGKNIADETAKVRENLQGIRTDIEDAFDTKNLPKAVEQANDLRDKLAQIADDARKAGVPMAQFSGEVAGLKARIAELETGGIAREADEFSRSVQDVGRSLDALNTGSMSPINKTLGEISERFDSLKAEILDQIEKNSELAAVNEKAARSMADLRDMLGQLETAHDAATAAATAQFQAEQALRDVAAQQAAQEIGGNISDLARARGDSGLETPQQQQLRQTEEQLQQERLSSLMQLRELESQLQEAQASGDQLEAQRLQGLIGLQTQYFDLVSDTTAKQIVGTQRLQDAFTDFTSGLSDSLFNMLTTFDFSLKGIKDTALRLLNDVFLKPATQNLAGSLSGFLSGLFSGGFAGGGTIPSGHWGIVGEQGPEPVFAGDRPLSVVPNDVATAGGRPIINVTVPGRMNDRDARRTGNQVGSAAAKRFSDARKAGLAG